METTLCACGCRTEIPAFAENGKPRKVLQGHQGKTFRQVVLVPCECGCGEFIPSHDKRNRPRRFLGNHGGRYVNDVRRAALLRASARGGWPKVPWNKGRSYVIAKRAVYSNKGAWNKALLRLYGNACMRCRWDEATVDAHHIIAKSKGGPFTLENGILLCPNCHRLAHLRPDVQASLPALKTAAIPINPSV